MQRHSSCGLGRTTQRANRSSAPGWGPPRCGRRALPRALSVARKEHEPCSCSRGCRIAAPKSVVSSAMPAGEALHGHPGILKPPLASAPAYFCSFAFRPACEVRRQTPGLRRRGRLGMLRLRRPRRPSGALQGGGDLAERGRIELGRLTSGQECLGNAKSLGGLRKLGFKLRALGVTSRSSVTALGIDKIRGS